MYIFMCGFAHMELLNLVNLQSCLSVVLNLLQCYELTQCLSIIQGVAFNVTHFESRIIHLLYTTINTAEHS